MVPKKGFMKTLKAFNPFETQKGGVKMKMKVNFCFNNFLKCTRREELSNDSASYTSLISRPYVATHLL